MSTENQPALPSLTDNGASVRRALTSRYMARQKQHRPIHWLGYTLSALNIIAIAFFALDLPLARSARDLPPALVRIAGDVTNTGQVLHLLGVLAIIVPVGLGMALRQRDRRRRYRLAYMLHMTAYLLISLLLTSAIVNSVKTMIGRARPPLYEQYGIFGFKPFDGHFLLQSFPSGHSAQIAAFMVALALLFPRFRPLLVGAALWIGATRVILGVHYPSDVAAGLALGAGLSIVMALLFSRFGLLFVLSPNGFPVPRVRRLMRRRPLVDG
jgi:undecaprenyl-diphosphatase